MGTSLGASHSDEGLVTLSRCHPTPPPTGSQPGGRSGTSQWLSAASQQMVLPNSSSEGELLQNAQKVLWNQACSMFIRPAEINQRKTVSNMMWLCCSSSPVAIRWSNRSSHIISLALSACYTNPATATLFLGADCSQPLFSPGNSTVMLTLYQSVIFDNPSLCIFFLWFQSLSETL